MRRCVCGRRSEKGGQPGVGDSRGGPAGVVLSEVGRKATVRSYMWNIKKHVGKHDRTTHRERRSWWLPEGGGVCVCDFYVVWCFPPDHNSCSNAERRNKMNEKFARCSTKLLGRYLGGIIEDFHLTFFNFFLFENLKIRISFASVTHHRYKFNFLYAAQSCPRRCVHSTGPWPQRQAWPDRPSGAGSRAPRGPSGVGCGFRAAFKSAAGLGEPCVQTWL